MVPYQNIWSKIILFIFLPTSYPRRYQGLDRRHHWDPCFRRGTGTHVFTTKSRNYLVGHLRLPDSVGDLVYDWRNRWFQSWVPPIQVRSESNASVPACFCHYSRHRHRIKLGAPSSVPYIYIYTHTHTSPRSKTPPHPAKERTFLFRVGFLLPVW